MQNELPPPTPDAPPPALPDTRKRPPPDPKTSRGFDLLRGLAIAFTVVLGVALLLVAACFGLVFFAK